MATKRPDAVKINGPYKSAGRVRYQIVFPDGDTWATAKTAKAALGKARLLAAAGTLAASPVSAGPTLAKATAAFVASRTRVNAWTKRTLLRNERDLTWLVKHAPDMTVARVDRKYLCGVIDAMAENFALASQRSRWATIASFFKWTVCEGWVADDPIRLVDRYDKPLAIPRAKRQMGRGKPQLRDKAEMVAYIRAALALPSPKLRVVTLLPLLMLLRNSLKVIGA